MNAELCFQPLVLGWCKSRLPLTALCRAYGTVSEVLPTFRDELGLHGLSRDSCACICMHLGYFIGQIDKGHCMIMLEESERQFCSYFNSIFLRRDNSDPEVTFA